MYVLLVNDLVSVQVSIKTKFKVYKSVRMYIRMEAEIN